MEHGISKVGIWHSPPTTPGWAAVLVLFVPTSFVGKYKNLPKCTSREEYLLLSFLTSLQRSRYKIRIRLPPLFCLLGGKYLASFHRQFSSRVRKRGIADLLRVYIKNLVLGFLIRYTLHTLGYRYDPLHYSHSAACSIRAMTTHCVKYPRNFPPPREVSAQ